MLGSEHATESNGEEERGVVYVYPFLKILATSGMKWVRMPGQARAVCDGLPGDIVALALPLDVDKIREAGLIHPGWQQRLPNNAVVAESVVAIVTRPGNPKNITGWDDLTRCPISCAALKILAVVLMPATPA